MKTKLAKIFVCIMLTIVAACVSVACISDYPDKPSDIAVTITGEQDGKIKKTYDGSPLTVAYEGTEAALTVTYTGSGETEYAESATAPADAGTYVAKLSYAADSKFNAFEKTVELEIEKAANEFSFTVADIIVGQGTIAPVVEKNVSGGAVSYTYVGLDGTDYEESAEAPEEVGKYRATAVVAATRNYYGNRETYDFSIVTDDPLYGVPEAIVTKANGLVRVNEFTLTESAGYKTNTANVKLSPAGVISANGDYIMIESDDLVHARTYVVVKSSTATNMYLRFAVKGNNTYEKIVNEPASGYKYFKALSVPEGYSILPVAFELSPDYTGETTEAITGVHVMFDGEIEICGFYHTEPVSADDVPESVMSGVEGKVALEYTLAAASYMTNNENVYTENGVVVAEGVNLEFLASVNSKKVYMLVKSSANVAAMVRFAIEGKSGWVDVLNNMQTSVRYTAEPTFEAGYSLVELNLTEFANYTGDKTAKIGGFHIHFYKGCPDSFTVYGIYTDPVTEDVVPSEILAKADGKTALSYELAAASWDTNANATKDENGVIHANKTNIELKVAVNTTKIYMIVKSSSATVAMIRFAIDGKTGWGDIVNTPDVSVKFKAEPAFAEGYSFVEISLTANADYTGNADAAIGGFHIHFYNGCPESFAIYGVYTDPVSEDGVPSEILAKADGKTALSYELATASWDTNVNATKDENGVIHANKTNIELKTAVNTTKIYMIVKSSSATVAMLRFAIDGKTGWVDIVNTPDVSVKFKAEPAFAEGYSFVEISLTANADYTGDADAAIGGFHMHFYNGTPDSFEIFGIYVD